MKFDWLLDSDLLREVQRATESLGEVRSKHVVNVAADAVPWVSAKAGFPKDMKPYELGFLAWLERCRHEKNGTLW